MSKLILYGISNCDTVRKARRWFEQQTIAYQFHDFRKDGITTTLIKKWCQQLDWETLLNKRGTTFRGLPDSAKNKLNQQTAIKLMQTHPTLIKRPVIEMGKKLTVGFNTKELPDWLQKLK